MDVNYILIKGNKHFKCHSLADYKKMKYEVLCLTDSKLAQKEISIL